MQTQSIPNGTSTTFTYKSKNNPTNSTNPNPIITSSNIYNNKYLNNIKSNIDKLHNSKDIKNSNCNIDMNKNKNDNDRKKIIIDRLTCNKNQHIYTTGCQQQWNREQDRDQQQLLLTRSKNNQKQSNNQQLNQFLNQQNINNNNNQVPSYKYPTFSTQNSTQLQTIYPHAYPCTNSKNNGQACMNYQMERNYDNPEQQQIQMKLDKFQEYFNVGYKPITKPITDNSHNNINNNINNNSNNSRIFKSLLKQLKDLHLKNPSTTQQLNFNKHTHQLKQTAYFNIPSIPHKYNKKVQMQMQMNNKYNKNQADINHDMEGNKENVRNNGGNQYFGLYNKNNNVSNKDNNKCQKYQQQISKQSLYKQHQQITNNNNSNHIPIYSQSHNLVSGINPNNHLMDILKFRSNKRAIRYWEHHKLQEGTRMYSHNHRYLRVAPRVHTQRSIQQNSYMRKVGGIRRQSSHVDLFSSNMNQYQIPHLKIHSNPSLNLNLNLNLNKKPVSSYTQSQQKFQKIRQQLNKIYNSRQPSQKCIRSFKCSQSLQLLNRNNNHHSRSRINLQSNCHNSIMSSSNKNLRVNGEIRDSSRNRDRERGREGQRQRENKILAQNDIAYGNKKPESPYTNSLTNNPNNHRNYYISKGLDNNKKYQLNQHYNHRLLLQKTKVQV